MKFITSKTLFSIAVVSSIVFTGDLFANQDTSSALVKSKEYQPNIVDAAGEKQIKYKTAEQGKITNNAATKAELKLKKNLAPLTRETARSYDDPDFWIYDSYVTLDNDIDYDGYYSSFTIEFDVDTIYQRAAIYAEIYSSTNGTFTPFYTTDIYYINGDSTQDAIVVENSLITGFPSNDYEIMIVIYDADTDDVVAVSDGTDDADLAFISLESENYEYVEPVDVIVVESGGSFGSWLLAGLGLVALRRAIK
jgi:hypothetical protein